MSVQKAVSEWRPACWAPLSLLGLPWWLIVGAMIGGAARDPPTAALHCSFCGKSHIQVKKLVAGPRRPSPPVSPGP